MPSFAAELAADLATSRRMPPAPFSLARKVLRAIEHGAKNNDGLHVSEIAIRAGLSDEDVIDGAEVLMASGHIYTTIDDYTWAVLED